MIRRRIAEALLTGLGGFGVASAADAQERRGRRRSTEESQEDYERRTGGRLMDAIETDALRRDLRENLRGARVRAAYDRDERLRAAVNEEGVAAILRGDQHIRLGQARAAIRVIEQYDPETAGRLRQQLARHEPKRDRDIDERGGAAAGGIAGVLAGLYATRGRGGGARRALARALGATGLGAGGAAGGAAAQNASGAVLTDTDAGDVGNAALAGGAVALGAAGGRRLLRGALRRASVRAEQRAAARPAVDAKLPYFEREAAERAADRTARQATRGQRTDDASLLAPAIAHMERVIEAAGRGRRVTGRTSIDKLRQRVARAKSRGDFRAAAEALDREYATVMEGLGLGRGVRIDLEAPEVAGAQALKTLERRVRQTLARRTEIAADIATMRPAQVRAQLDLLEAKRGRLSGDEAFTLRLLRQRISAAKPRTARTNPNAPSRGQDRGERYIQ